MYPTALFTVMAALTLGRAFGPRAALIWLVACLPSLRFAGQNQTERPL
jgi:hypothetical protein